MSRIMVFPLLVLLLVFSSGGPGPTRLSIPPVAGPGIASAALRDDTLAPTPELAPEPVGPGSERRPAAGTFGWPLAGVPAVVRLFQAPAHRYGPGHRGVDLAAQSGTPVLAAGAGTVVFAGRVAGREVVSLDHAGGLRTTYEPVLPSVTMGDVVARAQQIGTVQAGHPDCAAAACLHWGVRRGTDYLDPLRLLGLGQLRLLPWEAGSGRW